MASRPSVWMLAYLGLLAAASVWFADSAWRSVTGYRSQYALDREFEAGPALAERAVLVVMDGLRADRAAELPSYRALAARGTSGTMRVTVPSLSNPARAALVTGAWPEVSGVTTNALGGPVPVQSLISLARDRGMQVAISGFGFWSRAFGPDLDLRRPPAALKDLGPHGLAEWQAAACADALDHFTTAGAQLHVIGLLAADEAGHEFGGASDGYREVTGAVDSCLGRIVEAAGPETVVAAVSDHGHIHRWGHGGHGGLEPEVMTAPFAMAGPAVAAGAVLRVEIVDIAPTLATLLGLPIPANSQGRVLVEALDMPESERSGLRQRETAQRAALKAHLPDRDAALDEQRSRRLPWVLFAAAWLLAVAVAAARGQDRASLALAAAVFALAYGALFHGLQLGTSISAAVRQEYLNSFLGRNVLAAALASAAASLFLLRRLGGGRETAARLGVVLTAALGMAVAAVHALYGLRVDGFMLELGPGFKAYLLLFAIVGVSLGAIGVSLAMRWLPSAWSARS